MAEDDRSELRRFAGQVIEAFVRSAVLQYNGGPVSSEMLYRAAAAFSVSPALAAVIDGAAEHLTGDEGDDPFERLLIQPLADCFQSGKLSRQILPNYFHFIQLVMGDERTALAERCGQIATKLKAEPFPPFSWEDFTAHPQAKKVLWVILARIAESFRRFELRRDWFIKLMEYNPHAVSLAPNAFLPLGRSDEEPPPPFGLAEFDTLFQALFGPTRQMDESDKARFQKAFGHPPERVFGPLWLAAGIAG